MLLCCAMMKKKKNEELISYEMHAKDQNINTSKMAESVSLLDLIATLRMTSWNTNQGKVDVHMDNKEIWRRVNASTRVANNFN